MSYRASMVSNLALDLIKPFEGLRLKAHRCPAGVWTIGYGHTQGVKEGMAISPVEAEELLRKDAEKFWEAVLAATDATEPQAAAMTSLAFNIGLGAFLKSTLLKLHRQGDFEGASKQFERWTLAGGKRLPGLVRRRKAERDLYLKVSDG